MRFDLRGSIKRLVIILIASSYTAKSFAQFEPNLRTPQTIEIDSAFESCINDLEDAQKVIQTCSATTYTAPRWYQQPEAVFFLVTLGLSLGFTAGQRLK